MARSRPIQEDAVSSYRTQPPWEFLLSASRASLQSYELSRLSHAANLRKEIAALVEQWIEENSSAMLARWLMQYRDFEAPVEDSLADVAEHPGGSESVSDNFFAERASSPHTVRSAR
jgi:hypothetical protein